MHHRSLNHETTFQCFKRYFCFITFCQHLPNDNYTSMYLMHINIPEINKQNILRIREFFLLERKLNDS